MNIATETAGDKFTVKLDGRLDAVTAPSLDAKLALDGVRELVLDFPGGKQLKALERNLARLFPDGDHVGQAGEIENLAHVGRDIGHHHLALRFGHRLVCFEHAADPGAGNVVARLTAVEPEKVVTQLQCSAVQE